MLFLVVDHQNHIHGHSLFGLLYDYLAVKIKPYFDYYDLEGYWQNALVVPLRHIKRLEIQSEEQFEKGNNLVKL